MANKLSKKHPYAAIEWRVIDSPAYASLTFSARSLLVLLARQAFTGYRLLMVGWNPFNITHRKKHDR
jgi:hypothetical protein